MRLAITFIITICWISAVLGMINPNFTPVDLVRQATNIAVIDIQQADDKGGCTATLGKNLQGTTPAKLNMQLDTTSEELLRVYPAAFGAAAKKSALLFTGDFTRAVLQGADEVADKPVGALYLKTTWFALYQQVNGDYRITMDPLNLKAVWAGGDTTLMQALAYIIDDPRADIPVAVGTTWDTDTDVAALANVNRLLVINSPVAGSPLLLALSDEGDRAFQAKTEGKGFTDITTTLKLTTKSKLATAGYFNDDKLLDLALYDGNTLRFALNTGKGDVNIVDTGISGDDWKSISVIGGGVGVQDSLIVEKSGSLQLFSAQDGIYSLTAEPAATIAQLEVLGTAGACVVADFTGDNIADVLQTYANGTLLYVRKAQGEFAAPELALKASLGEKITSVKLGDFDADGQVDVLVTSDIGCTFLINQGGGKFRESFNETGEITYISKPNMVAGDVTDLNNDGRQDVVFFYSDMAPQAFFNRGFRCFGHAIPLEMDNYQFPAAAATVDGTSAGVAADFNGDGGSDIAFVGSDGHLRVIYRETATTPHMGLTVTLPAGTSGPLNITGYDGIRCLGARVATAANPAYFGKAQKGPLTVKWKMYDGAEAIKAVIILKPENLTMDVNK